MFSLNSTLNLGILPVLFQLEVYYKVDRLLTGLTAQQKEQLLDGIQIKHLYAQINCSFTLCYLWTRVKLRRIIQNKFAV